MKTLRVTSAIAIALLLGVSTSTSRAQDCGCAAAADCGCTNGSCANGGCDGGACGDCGAGKVCRLVCQEVEVKAVCYGAKEKEICVPSCGSKCLNIDCVKCGECSCDTTAGLCKIKYPTGKPGCAKQKTVKKLVKYETKKKVKVWKWEIVDGCGCDGNGAFDGCCTAGGDCGCATAGDGCDCATDAAGDGCDCAADAAGCGCAS